MSKDIWLRYGLSNLRPRSEIQAADRKNISEKAKYYRHMGEAERKVQRAVHLLHTTIMTEAAKEPFLHREVFSELWNMCVFTFHTESYTEKINNTAIHVYVEQVLRPVGEKAGYCT